VKRLRIALAIALAAHASVACSLFGSRRQTMEFASDPEGAEVYLDGRLVGATPLETRVRRRGDLSVMVKKEGCRTETRHPSKTLSALGFLDLIGGVFILVPFIGLMSSAAWKHDPVSYAILLRCGEEAKRLPAPVTHVD
jgi:hypothetical protein